MKRTNESENSGNTRSASEIGFVLRRAKRKSGPEMLRHVAMAKAVGDGPSTSPAKPTRPRSRKKQAATKTKRAKP